MSAVQQAQSASSWTEPPWSGWIETTGDALLILEAARRGLIPRVTRRLVDSERKMITSGSVFVFDEDESGIKRWTDGFFWSPSRILGNFLLYRETDKRGAGHRSARADQDLNDAAVASTSFGPDGARLTEAQSLSRPKTDNTGLSVDKQRERVLMGSLTNSYKFKPDGLMKKTFSVTISGVAQHLISYYKIEDVENGRLRSPSSLPELASLDISPEYLDKTHFRNPPKVEIGVDGVPRYRGEADDIDASPSLLSAPLSSGMPLLTEGRMAGAEGALGGKRAKRYEPYGSPPESKRARRNTGASSSGAAGTPEGGSSSGSEHTPTADPVSPQESARTATPQPAPAPTPATAVPPMPPAPGAYPGHYGMPAFYPMHGYPHHQPPPPPPGMYASPAPPPIPAGGPPGLHYAYAYAHPHAAAAQAQAQAQAQPPPQPSAPQDSSAGQAQASPQQQQQQQQAHAHAHAQGHAHALQAPAPAPAQAPPPVHRTDPSQSTALPPGAPAHQPPPPPPGQAPLPQPYYGYYHHPHGPPPPPSPAQYAPYQWPVYSGYPPQMQMQMQAYQAPAPGGQMQVQQQHGPPVVQQQAPPPQQKREDGALGGAGGGSA